MDGFGYILVAMFTFMFGGAVSKWKENTLEVRQ